MLKLLIIYSHNMIFNEVFFNLCKKLNKKKVKRKLAQLSTIGSIPPPYRLSKKN